MRFLHIADLHIGKRLGSFSLHEEQEALLGQIVAMAEAHADAVLIAGDLYDKAQPSGAAVRMVGDFLTGLAQLDKPLFLISGNHDNPEQISYCADLLRDLNIHTAGAFDGVLAKHVMKDAHGEITVWMLPFIKPFHVRPFFPDRQIETSEDAVRTVLESAAVNTSQRNILLMHQFVLGGIESDSETASLGGLDRISADLMAQFDYAALGHLHRPQRFLDGKVCYCGSMYKYSQSEESHQKAALLVTMKEKGSLVIETLPYALPRDVRSLRGPLAALTRLPPSDDYLYITLTDEVVPLDPIGALSIAFPRIAGFRVENSRTGSQTQFEELNAAEDKSPIDHFIDFYTAQNGGTPPKEAHLKVMNSIIRNAWEKSHETN